METLYFLFGLIIAITVHEFAHALLADRLGDPTPRSQGRLTLNPLAHLDPVGTLMLLLFRFGWGKPVIFDPYNLAHPRRDAGIISLAGPASNILLATILALSLRFLPLPQLLSPFFYITILLNITLAVFNLIPVYPLDGEKILAALLPRDLAYEYQAVMSRYGTIILIFLILPVFGTSPIISLISPTITFLSRLLLP
ncbi:MAG TPA: site-2 protease family protein [Patescibacteria group bacterium]|nr:site-2 protease family protein [Patescibacteria group bacterium]